MTDEVKRQKEELRRNISSARRALPEDLISNNSKVIAERIKEIPEYKNSNVIYLYFGVRGEVDTRYLIEDALDRSDKTALPRVMGEDIVFYYISSLEDIEEGFMGIPEPCPHCTKAYDEDFCLVIPGLAYDMNGFRLGFGGGYYDRFISSVRDRKIKIISPAFEFQIVDTLPKEKWDIRTDIIVTEKRIIYPEV